jgi:hypothetical protein
VTDFNSEKNMNSEKNEDRGGGSVLNDKLGGWISTNDRLPDLNINVLVTLTSGVTVARRFVDRECWFWAVANYIGGDLHSAETECDDEYAPLFWMPIPEAPNVELSRRTDESK